MNDKLVETVVSRAGIVRVRNALNGLLWLTAICLPLAIIAIYLFWNDLVLRYAFLAAFFLPLLATLSAFFWFMLKEPNRLQSEEFVLRQQELSVRRKGELPKPIDQNDTKDTLLIDAKSQKGDVP